MVLFKRKTDAQLRAEIKRIDKKKVSFEKTQALKAQRAALEKEYRAKKYEQEFKALERGKETVKTVGRYALMGARNAASNLRKDGGRGVAITANFRKTASPRINASYKGDSPKVKSAGVAPSIKSFNASNQGGGGFLLGRSASTPRFNSTASQAFNIKLRKPRL